MQWGPILAGVIPSIGVGLLFWLAMRAVVRADRHERAALAREEEKSGNHSGDGPQPGAQAGPREGGTE